VNFAKQGFFNGVINYRRPDCRVLSSSHTPPPEKAINEKITGFAAASKEKEGFARSWLKNATGRQLFLGMHIVIQCSYWFETPHEYSPIFTVAFVSTPILNVLISPSASAFT